MFKDNGQIVVYDVEANGLLGEAFAVGAVLLDTKSGEVLEKFFGKTFVTGAHDPWVVQNVLPKVNSEKVTHTKAGEMRTAFYRWLEYLAFEKKHRIYVFADWAHPVDSGFMVETHKGLPQGLRFKLPIVHEVATLLLAAGMDPDLNRYEYVKDELGDREEQKHHPLWDAEVSARAVRKVLLKLRTAIPEEERKVLAKVEEPQQMSEVQVGANAQIESIESIAQVIPLMKEGT